jgi:hypothetical protein
VHPWQRRSASRSLRHGHARCPSIHPGFDDRKPWPRVCRAARKPSREQTYKVDAAEIGTRHRTPQTKDVWRGYGRPMLSIASVNPPPACAREPQGTNTRSSCRDVRTAPYCLHHRRSKPSRAARAGQLILHAAWRRHRPCADGVEIAGETMPTCAVLHAVESARVLKAHLARSLPPRAAAPAGSSRGFYRVAHAHPPSRGAGQAPR